MRLDELLMIYETVIKKKTVLIAHFFLVNRTYYFAFNLLGTVNPLQFVKSFIR